MLKQMLLTGCLVLLSVVNTGFARGPNVLMIAVDDLNHAMSCYGHPQVKTPHIDSLAVQGVRFDKAYCQIPLCNPSRASILTGRRPDELRVYDLERHFRDQLPDVKTLPQLFKENGWYSARVGKLYHYNVPFGIGTNGLDDAASWDHVVNPKGRDTDDEKLIYNAEPHRAISGALSWLAADGTDEEQTDGIVATEAIKLLEAHQKEPFFLGVGFYRPHTPFVAPKKYFDLYPLDKIQLPKFPANDRSDIPEAAFAHNCPVPNYGLDRDTLLRATQAYYASVSFIDAQVGRLLDAVKRLKLEDSTIIIFWSDHGYHLGEHDGIWQKRTLFEECSRTPLIIYAPDQLGNGKPTQQVVEFIDIYPTIAELCGISAPVDLPVNNGQKT
ncbi:MAG: sulfatase [Planctomycetaceae bacterium]|nr:sulfatase [Planctomycetaceae bacterium]